MKTGDVMRGWLIGLIGAVALVAPAAAEVRIHLVDRTTPVVTDQIFEEEAWVLYQEGDSGYLFSVPRERVERLEIVQGGAVRTIQMTPSKGETIRGSRRRILLKILEAENKEADTIFKRLQDELKNLATTTSAVTAAMQPGASGPGAARAMSRQEAQVLGLQRERLTEVLGELTVVGLRIERILEQAAEYKARGPKPKYYFHR